MEVKFTEDIPKTYLPSPILISGESSKHLRNHQLIHLLDESEIVGIFEIRHEYYCSPFKQADVIDNLIAIGHEEHFYLFDFVGRVELLVLKLSGYFEHIYYNDGLIYVADAHGLHCIEKSGNIIWNNDGLGIDGVTVEKFTESEIHGSGEWDPPDGWEDFVLEKETGKIIYE